MANEFLAGRVAIDSYTFASSGAVQTLQNGVQMPGGILITGVTYLVTGARIVSGGDATYQPAIINTIASQTQYFVSTENISDFPAQTIASAPALLTAAGVYIASAGQLAMVQAASNVAMTFVPSIYVGYIDLA
jgi:hypothetical protein